MATHCSALSSLALAVLALAAVGRAQPVISAKSGLVTYLDGRVFIDNSRLKPVSPVSDFPEIQQNSVLRTEAGRAEVVLPPGYLLRVDDDSSFRLLNNQLIDTRLEMLTGAAILDVEASHDPNVRNDYVMITLKAGVVTVSRAGSYRFDCDPPRVRVFQGVASVRAGERTLLVSAGFLLKLDGSEPVPEKFSREISDDFASWRQRRASDRDTLVSGMGYVPGRARPAPVASRDTSPSPTLRMTLRSLIGQAYQLKDRQILNAPDWAGTARYTIVPPPPFPGESADARRQSLQALLAERFGLSFHMEPREVTVAALVVAHSGARLVPSQNDTEPQFRLDDRRLIVKRTSMEAFVRLLSLRMRQPIDDNTGLPGEYDLTVDFEPETVLPGSVNGLGTSFLTALEQQTGLRIDRRKTTEEALVVDRVEKPVPDSLLPAPAPASPATYVFEGASLDALIAFAYDVHRDQVLNLPTWSWSHWNRYTVKLEAQSAPPPSPDAASDPLRRAGQALLAQRFGLVLHKVTKPISIWALVVAKGGSKLAPSTAAIGPQISVKGSNQATPSHPWIKATRAVTCEKVTMQQFAERVLAIRVQRIVEDRTGLTGEYDFTLRAVPDVLRIGQYWSPAAPAFLRVLRDQLGLRLERAKGHADFLVIDHVRQPADNSMR
jgi:uncharacterized protein (TIGR03435 family)